MLGDNISEGPLDGHTVRVIQGRCPSRSLRDHQFIQKNSLHLLASWRPEARSEVIERLQHVPFIIPSLLTFFRDVLCLEEGYKILKVLLPRDCGGSLAQSFALIHNGQTHFEEQRREFYFQNRDLPSATEVEWLAYRQLWLFIFRHFPAPRMEKRKPQGRHLHNRKRKRNEDPASNGSDDGIAVFKSRWLNRLAQLALTNGYQIQQVDYRSTDAIAAARFLENLRPSKHYGLDADQLKQKAFAICQILDSQNRHNQAD